jgi:D-3-phosphoglycerate dehydrogenase
MTSRPQVLNLDCRNDYAIEKKIITAAGADLILHKCQTEDEIIAAGAEVDVVLVEASHVTARAIAGFRRCRGIVMYGVGYDRIDVAAATAAGIVVANVADYCTEEVADHAAALLLAAARRVTVMDRTIRAGGWYNFPDNGPLRRLNHLTLGLVGLGRIARGVAKRMAGFGVRVIATDPYLPAGATEPGIEIMSMERLLRESDLISVHVPLLPATRGLIGEKELRAMKPTALLVNTSRGPVVNEEALVRALAEKWIAGAALDVVTVEPLPAASPLRQFEQVIFTPHYGASSEEAVAQLARTVGESAAALVQGYWPRFPVNPQVKPRLALRPWSELARA